jgi:AcrR family transcriptional regulator
MLDTRAARREKTTERILAAAWKLARRDGLTGFNLRDLAQAVGVRAPSLYSYFDSKFALYDAMFAQANAELRDEMLVPDPQDFERTFRQASRLWVRWTATDPVRHQLLFQRTIPGFEPSAGSFAIAQDVFERNRAAFAAVGASDTDFDLWTAIISGIVGQQLANDPGGDRYVKQIDEAIDMFLKHIGYRKGKKA